MLVGASVATSVKFRDLLTLPLKHKKTDITQPSLRSLHSPQRFETLPSFHDRIDPIPPLRRMIPIVTPDLDFFYRQPGMRLKGGQFEMVRHLGSGQHSTVWLAFDFACPP